MEREKRSSETEQLQLAAQAGLLLLQENTQLKEQVEKLEQQLSESQLEQEQERQVNETRLASERRKSLVDTQSLFKDLQQAKDRSRELETQLATEKRKATAYEQTIEDMQHAIEILRREQSISEETVAATEIKADESQVQKAIKIPLEQQHWQNEESAKISQDIAQLQTENQVLFEKYSNTVKELDHVRLQNETMQNEKNAIIERLEKQSEDLQVEREEERRLICSLRERVRFYQSATPDYSDMNDSSNNNNESEPDQQFSTSLCAEMEKHNEDVQEKAIGSLSTELQVYTSKSNGARTNLLTTCDENEKDALIEELTSSRDRAEMQVEQATEKLSLVRRELQQLRQEWNRAQVSNRKSAANDKESGKSIAESHLLQRHFPEWVEDGTFNPAPAGDLNSPLIKCLLDTWSQDKAQLMQLTDWLHNSIRHTGKNRKLKLNSLSKEVAAGFLQLLIPIIREKHSSKVRVLRRERAETVTDIILETEYSQEDEAQFLYG